MIYHFIIKYTMFQFMDKSFIVTVRLSKETSYNYNITVRMYIMMNNLFVIYIYIYIYIHVN